MNTIPEIIDMIGGTSAFARAIGVKQSAASEMKRRGSIPVQYWPSLIAAAPKENALTYEDLVHMHLKREAAA